MEIRTGCCGFASARETYFRNFNLVEVQQTFYQPPRIETLKRWRGEAPEGFVFTLKAWQLITHEPSSPTYRRLGKPVPAEKRDQYGSFRQTEEVLQAWRVTLESARELQAAIIVFQTPASFVYTAAHKENIFAFFRKACSEAGPILLGWEPRGNWPQKAAGRICSELGVLHVVDPFISPPVDGEVRYFRLHGIGGYRHLYTDKELGKLLGWCGGRQTYCLFNNMGMFEDALRFQELARGKSLDQGR